MTDQNLWFVQSGNNLRIDVIGINNQATIDGWFNGGNQASELFTVGGLKLDSQISQLVQAMAAYSGSHTGFDPAAATFIKSRTTRLFRIRLPRHGMLEES